MLPRKRLADPSMRVVVVGAGFAGIGAVAVLRAAGLRSITVLEHGDDVGGTWRDNTYPGCACDIPSQLYSFSFARNPDWSRSYPAQPEVLAYLQRVAERFRVHEHLRLSTAATALDWDEDLAIWRVTTSAGDTIEADVVLIGTGPLSKPLVPDLPGLDRFQGTVFHSAQWDHAHDLRGERVAVVGTGASAIQIVPEIAAAVERLHVFQRTPPWVFPRDDRPFRRRERLLFRALAPYQRLQRWKVYAKQELLSPAFTGRRFVLANDVVSAEMRARAVEHLETAIADPALRSILTPDYPPGCKRILISNDWYPALARPNVELVPHAVSAVTDRTVVGAGGIEREVDTIVLATGFRATEFVTPLVVRGRARRDLAEEWRRHASTHLGISSAGFPNLFHLAGPSTGLGHNSIVFMIEAQLHWITGALRHLADRRRATGRAVALDVRADVQASSYAELQDRMRSSVWLTNCRSWYQSADGHVDTLWPGNTAEYWRRTRWFRPDDYRELTPG